MQLNGLASQIVAAMLATFSAETDRSYAAGEFGNPQEVVLNGVFDFERIARRVAETLGVDCGLGRRLIEQALEKDWEDPEGVDWEWLRSCAPDEESFLRWQASFRELGIYLYKENPCG